MASAPTSAIDLPRFDLTDLYTGIEDPAIEADLTELERLWKQFADDFRGKLGQRLGEALLAYEKIETIEARVSVYPLLLGACDTANEQVQKLQGRIREVLARLYGTYASFFSVEIGAMDQVTFDALLANDSNVKRFQPMLQHIREGARFRKSEEVEGELAIRSPFTVAPWKAMLAQQWAGLRVRVDHPGLKDRDGDKATTTGYTLTEAFRIMEEHTDAAVRAATLCALNDELRKNIAPSMRFALNVVTGVGTTEVRSRGYEYPRHARDRSNRVRRDVVEALHTVVCDEGAKAARRYYKLLAAHLGISPLGWGDRNVKLPGGDERSIPWDEAWTQVVSVFHSFSPTMGTLIENMVKHGHVDVPHLASKRHGAFNCSIVLPEPHGPRSYVFLNYLGTPRDVMTVAHEFGHAAHGLLAAATQGPLMYSPAIAYAETASTFAEDVTFGYVVKSVTDPRERLRLLMNKISDFLNTTVRQISFSLFEERMHARRARGELAVGEICDLWLEVTAELYGADGDIFDMRDTGYLWAYVSHFFQPFYVYGYAFGELLAVSLLAVRDSMGGDFERLYLDLLRAGGTKGAIELLAPFNLDPTNPDFWRNGIAVSATKWLDEAEALSRQLGVAV